MIKLCPCYDGHWWRKTEVAQTSRVYKSMEPSGFRMSAGISMVPDLTPSKTDNRMSFSCVANTRTFFSSLRSRTHWLNLFLRALSILWRTLWSFRSLLCSDASFFSSRDLIVETGLSRAFWMWLQTQLSGNRCFHFRRWWWSCAWSKQIWSW